VTSEWVRRTAAIEDVHAKHETEDERDDRASDPHAAPADHPPAGLPAQVVEISATSTGCPTHRYRLESLT